MHCMLALAARANMVKRKGRKATHQVVTLRKMNHS